MTPAQARIIIDMHDISEVFESCEETDMLFEYNRELYDAYVALKKIADTPNVTLSP